MCFVAPCFLEDFAIGFIIPVFFIKRSVERCRLCLGLILARLGEYSGAYFVSQPSTIAGPCGLRFFHFQPVFQGPGFWRKRALGTGHGPIPRPLGVAPRSLAPLFL